MKWQVGKRNKPRFIQVPASGKEWGVAYYNVGDDGKLHYSHTMPWVARASDAVLSCNTLGHARFYLTLPRRAPFSMTPLKIIDWKD